MDFEHYLQDQEYSAPLCYSVSERGVTDTHGKLMVFCLATDEYLYHRPTTSAHITENITQPHCTRVSFSAKRNTPSTDKRIEENAMNTFTMVMDHKYVAYIYAQLPRSVHKENRDIRA